MNEAASFPFSLFGLKERLLAWVEEKVVGAYCARWSTASVSSLMVRPIAYNLLKPNPAPLRFEEDVEAWMVEA